MPALYHDVPMWACTSSRSEIADSIRQSYASVTSLGVLSNTWSHSEQENSGEELEDESAVATLEGATAI